MYVTVYIMTCSLTKQRDNLSFTFSYIIIGLIAKRPNSVAYFAVLLAVSVFLLNCGVVKNE